MAKWKIQIDLKSTDSAILDVAKTALSSAYNSGDVDEITHDWKEAIDIDKFHRRIHRMFIKSKAKADEIYSKLKTASIDSGISGKYSQHLCAEPNEEQYNCKDDSRAQYKEHIF